jgi:heme A synthase
MKTTHALNFFLVGLAMCFGPALWPQEFFDSASRVDASAWWLICMGAVQALLGAWVLGLNGVPRLFQLLAEWEPVKLDFTLPDVGWVLPESFYAGMVDDEEVSIALTLQQQLRLSRA